MVIQDEVSLVSHKANLKVTSEQQSQEKYYRALCTCLSENSAKIPWSPPPPHTSMYLCKDGAPSEGLAPAFKWIKHGRWRQVSPKCMTAVCNKWWERDTERGRKSSWSEAGNTVLLRKQGVCVSSSVFLCFCNWILFSQLCLSPPSPSLLLADIIFSSQHVPSTERKDTHPTCWLRLSHCLVDGTGCC